MFSEYRQDRNLEVQKQYENQLTFVRQPYYLHYLKFML
jgi:hypothetical protein